MLVESQLQDLLSYPKLDEYLKENVKDNKRVIDLYHEIRGDYKSSVIGAASKVIDHTFLKLYNSINLDIMEGMDLKQLSNEYNLILCPNHQSHADYVALTYLLHKHYQLEVYVAGGINLNIFLMGQFFRKAGAFFIRRKFNDDQLYKLTLEAYIFTLLKKNKIVEFFFEGGRTRTGKLLKPRFGLFRMILDAHSYLPNARPLMFVPVAIAHEHIPEEKAHKSELQGKEKKPESSKQLFKILKLFNKKLGSIHVRINDGIIVYSDQKEIREQTNELAIECFKRVGKSMPVTPSSLLALTMLDESHGALTWKQIEERCFEIINFCLKFDIPVTSTLRPERISQSIKLALDIFINNQKINIISNEKLNTVFYAIKENNRIEMVYHKNMILHHFLVPGFINLAWFNIFNGKITSDKELNAFLYQKRKELKYEFYLPSIKEMIKFGKSIVRDAVGREIQTLHEVLTFSYPELYKVADKVKRFSSAFSFIYEAYFLSSITIKYLASEQFDHDKFLAIAHELFLMEIEHGRVIKYPESYSVPLLKDTLLFFINIGAIKIDPKSNKYQVQEVEKINFYIEKFATDLNDQMSINLKFSTNDY
jgi:glycerol-3-phosphate O-acyltransferase